LSLARRLLSFCTFIAEAGFVLNFGTTTYAVNQFGPGVGSGLAAQSLLLSNPSGFAGLLSGSSLLSGNMPVWTMSQLVGMVGVAGVPYLLYRLRVRSSILFLVLAGVTGLGLWKLGAGANNLVQIWNLLKKTV
jgi:hypothetical protein